MYLRKLSDAIASVCKAVIVLCMVTMIGILFVQVVLRYSFGTGFPWAEELSVTLCAWMVFLGAALGLKEGFHVRFTLLTDNIAEWAVPLVERAIQAIGLCFGVALAYSGYHLSVMSGGIGTATLGVPVWILYTVTCASGAAMALFSLENIIYGSPKSVLGGQSNV